MITSSYMTDLIYCDVMLSTLPIFYCDEAFFYFDIYLLAFVSG